MQSNNGKRVNLKFGQRVGCGTNACNSSTRSPVLVMKEMRVISSLGLLCMNCGLLTGCNIDLVIKKNKLIMSAMRLKQVRIQYSRTCHSSRLMILSSGVWKPDGRRPCGPLFVFLKSRKRDSRVKDVFFRSQRTCLS